MIGPTPNSSVSVVPDAATARADAPMRLLELVVEALHVGQQLDGQVAPCGLDRGRRLDALEERDGVRSVEFLGDPAR